MLPRNHLPPPQGIITNPPITLQEPRDSRLERLDELERKERSQMLQFFVSTVCCPIQNVVCCLVPCVLDTINEVDRCKNPEQNISDVPNCGVMMPIRNIRHSCLFLSHIHNEQANTKEDLRNNPPAPQNMI